jgi:hypothetical protein
MKPKVLLAALLATTMAGPALADSHATGMSGDRPSRGMSEQSVEARYGAPAAKVAAVGEPPISRWEYAEFIVYFEYDKVIHAVTRRQ